ncbi:putative short-chain dehydrogenase [Xylaria intraflava]|nr:putative short-chain dehydrogenase [Xylaria intraflava]
MPETTHPEFNEKTEALEVAKAFAKNLRGKTVFVTGGNPGGLAFATCQAFASQSPAHIIIASRTQSKIEQCIDLLKAEYPAVDYRALVVDLSSQKSVRKAAAEVLSWTDIPTIDIVVNNAGVMGIAERTLSEDGVEMHFATNHIGHWLLTCSLMPKLIAAAKKNPKGTTRVVNVSSASPRLGGIRWSDMHFNKLNKDLPEDEQPNYELLEAWAYKNARDTAYQGLEAYNVSKVANVLFGVEANKRLYEKHGIFTVALHPGLIMTELGRSFPPENLAAVMSMLQSGIYVSKTLAAGTSTTLVAALDPKLGPGGTRNGKENYGAYMDDCQISEEALPRCVSSAQGERLWKLSEELVNEKFNW